MADISLSTLETAFSSIHSTRLSELASSTIIVFDHLITLDEEVQLVWKAPWSPGKCLFIMNRYYSLAVVIFNNYGLHWFKWQGWSGLALSMIAQVILQLRLFALYYLNTRVLLLIIITFLAASATSATLMGIVLSKITASNDIPGVPFCVAHNISYYFYAFWIPALFFETFLCSLAVLRGLQNFTSQSTIYLSGKRIFEILVRDSIMYYLVIFAAYLLNSLFFALASDALIEVPIGFSVAMSCVMGNRLLLNIREAVRKSDLDGKLSFTDPDGGLPLRAMKSRSYGLPLMNNDVEQSRTIGANDAVS